MSEEVEDAVVAPESVEQLCEVIATTSRVIPVGNRTKAPLSHCPHATAVSLRQLKGILEYEPSEFTFTAWAGTPVSEIQQTLRERNQYLPFDPLLVEAGATIGGTVAAGMAGPGRFRYGGVRDFLIGVKLLGGDGQFVQGGGKVVKNAAGFDIPKFLVGSMGRYALMLELSFKVFPQPPATCTLRFPCASHDEAMQRIATVACSRWEADAVDYRPAERTLFVRLAGPAEAVDAIAAEIQSGWPEGTRLDADEAAEFWRSTTELHWADPATTFDAASTVIVKVPTTSKSYLKLQQAMEDRSGISIHLSVAAGVAWIALDDPSQTGWLDEQLRSLALAGLIVRGGAASSLLETPKLGHWHSSQMQQAIKQAMDPQAKFPGV